MILWVYTDCKGAPFEYYKCLSPCQLMKIAILSLARLPTILLLLYHHTLTSGAIKLVPTERGTLTHSVF